MAKNLTDVKSVADACPASFYFGEAHGVGPSLFVLFPLLTETALQPLHQLIMDVIQQLIQMLAEKDPWALHALLKDCLQLFSDSCQCVKSGSTGLGANATELEFLLNFAVFAQERLDDVNTAHSCKIEVKSEAQQLLAATGAAQISQCILRIKGQIFYETIEVSSWSAVLDHLNWAASSGSAMIFGQSLTLLECMLKVLPLPWTFADKVSILKKSVTLAFSQTPLPMPAVFDRGSPSHLACVKV